MSSQFLNYLNENSNSRSPHLQASQLNLNTSIKSNINNVIGRPFNNIFQSSFDSIRTKYILELIFRLNFNSIKIFNKSRCQKTS